MKVSKLIKELEKMDDIEVIFESDLYYFVISEVKEIEHEGKRAILLHGSNKLTKDSVED